jgi:hypothetical protein
MLYREKLEDLVSRSKDLRESLETFLGPKVVHWLEENQDPGQVVDLMEASPEWRATFLALSLYLQKRGNRGAVKQALRLWKEDRKPVSHQTFLRELKELELAEFLELL